jgi:hypothetical protein
MLTCWGVPPHASFYPSPGPEVDKYHLLTRCSPLVCEDNLSTVRTVHGRHFHLSALSDLPQTSCRRIESHSSTRPSSRKYEVILWAIGIVYWRLEQVFALSWLQKARKAGRGVKSVKSATATRCRHATLLRRRGRTDVFCAFAARDVLRLGPRFGREGSSLLCESCANVQEGRVMSGPLNRASANSVHEDESKQHFPVPFSVYI